MKLIHFEKKLGLGSAISMTVGAVIGVGIFVIVGPIGRDCGGAMPLAFLLAALPAIFGTLVSIALGGTIPADGGGYFYSKSLLGQKAGIITSLLIVLGALGSLAAVSIGVADYIRVYFPEAPRALIAVGLLILTGAVNYAGIMASTGFQVGMVVQLASCLLIIAIVGFFSGHAPDLTAPLPKGTGGLIGGMVLAAFSYTGFNIIGELGDEIENPRRNIPITIAVGLSIIIFFYFGMAWVVAGNLTLDQMANSKTAMLDATMAISIVPHWFKHYVNLAALTAGITSLNAVFMAIPRELAALAEDKIIPSHFLRYNQKRQTFTLSLILVTIVGSAMVLTDLNPDYFGVFCVAGLLLSNAILSFGALFLIKKYPDRVAAAPFPIRKSWLIPCAVISCLLSLAFGGIGIIEVKLIGVIVVLIVIAALILGYTRGRAAATGPDGPESK